MKEIFKPAVSLFIITLIAAVCLGFVYNITLEPIENQKARTMAESMSKLLTSADEFKNVEPEQGSGITSLTAGYSGTALQGYIIGVIVKGYGGDVELLAALNTGGAVEGVKIVTHNETPGLGANAASPAFTGQYTGKSGRVTVTKGDPKETEIQAITSATITSRAVTNGVNIALEYYNNYLKGGR